MISGINSSRISFKGNRECNRNSLLDKLDEKLREATKRAEKAEKVCQEANQRVQELEKNFLQLQPEENETAQKWGSREANKEKAGRAATKY